MNLSVSIPFYNYNLTDSLRYQITKKNIQHYFNIQQSLKKQNINVYLNLIGSENDKSYNLSKLFFNGMVEYTEFKQIHTETIKPEDLRAKYNFCFQTAKTNFGDKCKFHCISGSNDFVSSIFFDELINCELFDLVGVSANKNVNNLVVLDYLNKKGFLGSGLYENEIFGFQNNFIGGFYALNVNLLEKLNYNPFQFNNDEIGLEKYCLEQKYKFHMINCEILNVKSNTDLNTYKSCETLKKANLSCEQLNTYFNYLDSI
jgi:hypothetical protein